MPNPTIRKSQNYWELKYYYPPRQFDLFGATEEERKKIASYCLHTIICGTFEEAVEDLRRAYKARQVVRNV